MIRKYELQVDRTELVEALAQISRLKRRVSTTRVKLVYEDGELAFALPRFRTRASAEGEWYGELCVPIWWLRKLAEIPPSEDPVTVTYSSGRVAIGEGSVEICR